MKNSFNNFFKPSGSFPAGTALPARFMSKKMSSNIQSLYHAGRIIHDNDTGGSQHRTSSSKRVKIHFHINLRGSQNGSRNPSRDNGLQSAITANSSCMFINNLT